MFKVSGFFIIVFVLVVMFVAPVRNYMNNLFVRDKSELEEEQVIGTVSGYSPRVEEIQIILTDAHFDLGPADGIMGSRTRKAIRDFQKEKGLWPSGKVNSKTWLELNKEKEVIKKEMVMQPVVLSSENYPHEVEFEEEIRKIMEPQEKAIKERFPKDKKKQIQIALQKAGFYRAKIDGKIGLRTKEAIKAFQKAKGLRADGVVGAQTWAELNKHLRD